MNQRKLSVDAVIAGSGAGGAAIAGSLLEGGLSVAIVEAGPLRRSPVGSHVRNSVPYENDLPAVGRLLDDALSFPGSFPGQTGLAPGDLAEFKVIYGVGGMFSYWTCNCPIPHPRELSPCLPLATWESLLARARERLCVGFDLGQNSVRQERIIERVRRIVGPLEPGREVQPMPTAVRLKGGTPRFSSADDLLGPVENHARLTLLPDLVAREIVHSGNRATGVVAYPRAGGDSTAIAAGIVVVACGATGTPQLLAASGVDAGPALGRGIFDHPSIGSRVMLKPDIVRNLDPDDPLFTVWIPFAPGRPWHNQVVRFPANPGPIELDAGPKETADIFTFSAMGINPENRLEFAMDRPDALGLPTVRGHYRLSRADFEAVGSGLDEHFRIAAEIGDIEANRWVPVFFGPGWSTHLMGGCGMGTHDDGSNVVDPNGRLWGYDNLFVAGNSVHSTTNAGNPTSITIAFALNTADAILGVEPAG